MSRPDRPTATRRTPTRPVGQDHSPSTRALVRATVDVPVITFGVWSPTKPRPRSPAGKADFVAMGRKLLADPDLPNKLAEGRVDDIRPCIYQYRCIGNIFVKESLHCIANAHTGREHDLAVRAEHAARGTSWWSGPAREGSNGASACSDGPPGHAVGHG